MATNKPPKNFFVNRAGELACPHRELSCCPQCAKTHREIVEVFGRHFWVTNAAERRELGAKPL